MPIPDKLILYDDNTQLLQLFGLAQELPGTPPDIPPTTVSVTDAVVRATLKDGEDVNVPGCINILLSPLGSPPTGNYSGQVNADFNPPIGGDYVLIVDGDNGPDHLHLEILTEVKSRRV